VCRVVLRTRSHGKCGGSAAGELSGGSGERRGDLSCCAPPPPTHATQQLVEGGRAQNPNVRTFVARGGGGRLQQALLLASAMARR
jgi:hypothetical protein